MPVRIAIINDYEIVVAGIASVLAPFADRIEVVELGAGTRAVSEEVDVVLYDTFGQVQGGAMDVDQLVNGGGAKVVVFSWNQQPELVEQAMERGAKGYLSKALTAEELVKAIERVHAGEIVTAIRSDLEPVPDSGNWPGRQHGLTQRESEVLALITQGLTNQEIADRAYISINSVKTYIRTAYRKIGVARRSQAVSWGMDHGFRPDRSRVVIDEWD